MKNTTTKTSLLVSLEIKGGSLEVFQTKTPLWSDLVILQIKAEACNSSGETLGFETLNQWKVTDVVALDERLATAEIGVDFTEKSAWFFNRKFSGWEFETEAGETIKAEGLTFLKKIR